MAAYARRVEDSIAMRDLAQSHAARWDGLYEEMSMWLTTWQELTEFIMPRKANVRLNRTPGQTQTERLLDATAVHANELLAASMQGSLTSGSVKWFYYRIRGIDYGVDGSTTNSGGGVSVTGTHVQITGAVTTQATTTYTSLKISGASNVTLASGATVTVAGILKAGNNVSTISGGTALRANTTSRELSIRVDQAGDFAAQPKDFVGITQTTRPRGSGLNSGNEPAISSC